MKYLIALTLALSSIAHAQTFHMPNEAGGEVVLTGRDCPKPELQPLRAGYAFHPNGMYLGMCWALMDGMVHVVWLEDGSRSVYSPNAFEERNSKPKPKKGSDV